MPMASWDLWTASAEALSDTHQVSFSPTNAFIPVTPNSSAFPDFSFSTAACAISGGIGAVG